MHVHNTSTTAGTVTYINDVGWLATNDANARGRAVYKTRPSS